MAQASGLLLIASDEAVLKNRAVRQLDSTGGPLKGITRLDFYSAGGF
jgi:hypothetical protein